MAVEPGNQLLNTLYPPSELTAGGTRAPLLGGAALGASEGTGSPSLTQQRNHPRPAPLGSWESSGTQTPPACTCMENEEATQPPAWGEVMLKAPTPTLTDKSPRDNSGRPRGRFSESRIPNSAPNRQENRCHFPLGVLVWTTQVLVTTPSFFPQQRRRRRSVWLMRSGWMDPHWKGKTVLAREVCFLEESGFVKWLFCSAHPLPEGGSTV